MHVWRGAILIMVASLGTVLSAQVKSVQLTQTSEVSVPSPNGKWLAVTQKSAAGTVDLAIKHSETSNQRVLTSYRRTGKLLWTGDSTTLVFLDARTPTDSVLRVYKLSGTRLGVVTEYDNAIRRHAMQTIRFRKVNSYSLDFVSLDAKRLVLRVFVSFPSATGNEFSGSGGVDCRYAMMLEKDQLQPLGCSNPTGL